MSRSGNNKPLNSTHAKRTVVGTVIVPSKRRKLEHTSDAAEKYPCSPGISRSVKRELSPSLPPSLALRTSGTVHVDIPHDCRKTQRDWKERRHKWIAQETIKLKSLGLKISKCIVRDDGLALDWVSLVPVCPLTLKPPSPVARPPSPVVDSPNPVVSSAQVHEPQNVPSIQPLVDPLGHALRDQTVFSPLINPSAHRSCVLNVPPGETRRNPLPPMEDVVSSVSPDFVVVGAATRKQSEGPGSERAAESGPDHTTQWEHRKLLPPDLRPSTRFRYANKEGAKSRNSRRLAWITKEIEKVEGYTGEKVGGFRYDGDDVIIQLNRRLYYARRRHEQAAHAPVRPSQLEHSQAHVSDTHSPHLKSRRTGITVPSANAPKRILPESLSVSHSQGSINIAGDTTSTSATTVATHASIPDSSPPLGKQSPSPTSATTSIMAVFEQKTTLVESATNHNSNVSQARCLSFLERYLQLFDSDRDGLLFAYTPNATFSLTKDKYGNNTDPSGSSFLQIVKMGRPGIAETLKMIGRDLRHSSLANIAYNITALDDMSPGGLLLTCEGALLPVDTAIHQPGYECCFSRIFVLRQNNEGDRQTWPLQIVAEQLTIQRRVLRE